MGRRHKVEFISPGTAFSEISVREIQDRNDLLTAVEMSKTIVERYGARPYAFRFFTEIFHPPIDDGEGGLLNVEPKRIDVSEWFFLGGTILKYEDTVNKDNERLTNVMWNMRLNKEPLAVETTNGWTHVAFFGADDCVVSETAKIIRCGQDDDLLAYRTAKLEEWAANETADTGEE